MTRKDYVVIANSLKLEADFIRTFSDEQNRQAAHASLYRVSRTIAGALASDNPRFDRERFLRATGI